MKLFSVLAVVTACALLTACVSETDPEPTPTAHTTPGTDTKEPAPTNPATSGEAEGPAPHVESHSSVQSASGGGPQPLQLN